MEKPVPNIDKNSKLPLGASRSSGVSISSKSSRKYRVTNGYSKVHKVPSIIQYFEKILVPQVI
jgi:hypothetical protein